MQIVLLSGGSGKRLWPMSTESRPKQFLKVFKQDDEKKENTQEKWAQAGKIQKSEAGDYESMLQRMYRYLKAADSNAEITVAAPKSQVAAIHAQLGNLVDVSVEPAGRDTFAAIVLASAYLADKKHLGEDEIVVVCPVDPYVERPYFEALAGLPKLLEGTGGSIALMGLKPLEPSEKFGYILPDAKNALRVKSFLEKPSRETARDYIEAGALWNSGVFAFRLGYVREKARELCGFIGYQDLFENYEELPRLPFDKAVVEKESNICVYPFEGTWDDLGTWDSLTQVLPEQVLGKGICAEGCENVHIVNEMNVPVLALGLSDVVISATTEGILVSDKASSMNLKPYVTAFEDQVTFAEKSWGNFKIIDTQKGSMTIKVTLNPGNRMNYHSHKNRDEVWVVIAGCGYTIVDGMKQQVNVGDVITMSAGCRHTILAESKLQLIEVQLGDAISVEDKQKFDLDYE